MSCFSLWVYNRVLKCEVIKFSFLHKFQHFHYHISVEHDAGLLYFPGNMFTSQTAGNTGKYQEIWEILGNTKFQIMDF